MAGLLWKLITSPNEKTSSGIIKEAIRARLLWQKPKEEPKSWFWRKKDEKPEKEPESFWVGAPKEEKKGWF